MILGRSLIQSNFEVGGIIPAKEKTESRSIKTHVFDNKRALIPELGSLMHESSQALNFDRNINWKDSRSGAHRAVRIIAVLETTTFKADISIAYILLSRVQLF